jgi:hypothetical protein
MRTTLTALAITLERGRSGAAERWCVSGEELDVASE